MTEAGQKIELPPEAERRILWHAGDCGLREGEWWTFSQQGLLELAVAVAAEQVRQAVLQERERCAMVCEAHMNDPAECREERGENLMLEAIADAIRRGSADTGEISSRS